MEALLNYLPNLLADTITAVITSLLHNWIPLLLAIVIAAMMKVYVNAEKLKSLLLKRTKVSIFISVIAGAFTPLCACGTMAVVVGMLTTTLPWGPMMAFLTSSPLMSPDGFIMLAGIVNFKFAAALAVASIVIGLGSGYLTHFIEVKTDFLKNQTRFSNEKQIQTCGCSATVTANQEACACSEKVIDQEPIQTCGCSKPAPVNKRAGHTDESSLSKFLMRIKFKELSEAMFSIGIKQILLYFSIFVAIGYLINSFVPTSLIMTLFSAKSAFAIPLAALIGLPLYVSGESAIPLINALMAGGASGGAMLAFMITGQGTSAWVIAGITAFMKKRVILLYISFILFGGILCGYLYEIFQTIMR